MIAGGRKFRQGRYLRWAPEIRGFEGYFDRLERPANDLGLVGVPNQKLLGRLAEAFELVDENGLPLTAFGEQSIFAPDGSHIDLGGSLTRL